MTNGNYSSRRFTKSLLKIAQECETKLFYVKKDEYPDKSQDDPFMQSLAASGYQVGELAKYYWREGKKWVEVTERNPVKAAEETVELMKHDEIIIYEGCFRYGDLYARADIIIKKMDIIELYEVKMKSYDSDKDDYFTYKKIPQGKNRFREDIFPYLFDVAYQKYLISLQYPEYKIRAYLVMPDKAKRTSVDGLNQKFLISRAENSKGYRVIARKDVTREELGEEILARVREVDEYVDEIIGQNVFYSSFPEMSFKDYVNFVADKYIRDERIDVPIGTSKCKECKFYATREELDAGKKDGRLECWRKHTGLPARDFEKPLIISLWNGAKAEWLKEGKYFLEDITEDMLAVKKESEVERGLSTRERRWLQVQKRNDNTPWFDYDDLSTEMKSWKFPLHFIDFETAQVAIPFHKGMPPYEKILFQFSHHQVEKAGSTYKIIHEGQFISTDPGVFPNFELVRALKKQLEKDDGTIFRYWTHENTYLGFVHDQLQASSEVDKEELISFIRSITYRSSKDHTGWEAGPRNMVDLGEKVKRYYFHRLMNGRISLKTVLPTILNTSAFLQGKYSQPIYGNPEIIPSLNFQHKNKIWLEKDNETGVIIDPYHQLEKAFADIDHALLKEFLMDDENIIAEGGAAMTAYCMMQFTEMSDLERTKLKEALLRYCELDTLAMVLLWEYWNDEINSDGI